MADSFVLAKMYLNMCDKFNRMKGSVLEGPSLCNPSCGVNGLGISA